MGYVSLAEDQMDRLAESLWMMSKSGELVLAEARDHGYHNFARSLSQLISQAVNIKTELEHNLELATDPSVELANELRRAQTELGRAQDELKRKQTELMQVHEELKQTTTKRDELQRSLDALRKQRGLEREGLDAEIKSLSDKVKTNELRSQQALQAVKELNAVVSATANKDSRFKERIRQIGFPRLVGKAIESLAQAP